MTDARDLDIREAEGGCHCGAVRFHLHLADGLKQARRCNCSICRMKGAVKLRVPMAALTVTQGADRLSEYRFNTGTARHYFCLVCGIYTHHRTRSHPDHVEVNLACLDGLSPFDFTCVPVSDGINHRSDTGEADWSGTVGMLRHEPARKEESP